MHTTTDRTAQVYPYTQTRLYTDTHEKKSASPAVISEDEPIVTGGVNRVDQSYNMSL